MEEQERCDPVILLKTAVEELEKFIHCQTENLELDPFGRFICKTPTKVERMTDLLFYYFGSLFLNTHWLSTEEEKYHSIKQAILRFRDTIQSHIVLLFKFQQGDENQQKFANQALRIIHAYNRLITKTNSKWVAWSNIRRHRLIQDQEIKNRIIDLPHTVVVQHASHPAQKIFKDLHQSHLPVNKTYSKFHSTYKKTNQFMLDIFCMKAIRMIQTHVGQEESINELLSLIKQTPIDIEQIETDLIEMKQLLEIGPGSFIFLTATFKHNFSDQQFIRMPILNDFQLNSEVHHTGFPYPSQYTGWALADKWIEACPLRMDQVPLFQAIDRKKRALIHQLLFDQNYIKKARSFSKLKKEVFDKYRDQFVPLHREIQEAMIAEMGRTEMICTEILDAYYGEVLAASSPFEMLTRVQQQLLQLFIIQPIKSLHEEWLNEKSTPLRIGTAQEKLHAAYHRLAENQKNIHQRLNIEQHVNHSYILQQGAILGDAFHGVALQYQSEKMGFAPPLLNEFERKLQACAFHQLIHFLEECEERLEMTDPKQIKNYLLDLWTFDLKLLKSSNIEDFHSQSIQIINELEVYFNSRFYSDRAKFI